MLYNAMLTEDNIMIIETGKGVYSLNLDNLRDYPNYEKLKRENKLKDFYLDYDAIIWGEDLDLGENGIFEYGRRLNV